MQILTQVRTPGQLDWRSVDKLACSETAALDWQQTTAGGQLLLAHARAINNVSIVPMSDYTAGLWLHFIGNFAASAVGPDDFALQRSASNALTLKPRYGRAPALPVCIALSVTAREAVEFHWLLVYRPLRDVTRNGIDSDAGALLGAWRFDGDGGNFHPLDKPNEAIDLTGCYAYLCTFHRTSAPSAVESDAIKAIETTGGTQALIACMFPDQDRAVKEATIRMVPKALGQIAIA
ncbi:MAG TPA: hypothetical protein VFS02_18290 [Telluria sp.]|nr:hypothetical protein [Telluria sp.]